MYIYIYNLMYFDFIYIYIYIYIYLFIFPSSTISTNTWANTFTNIVTNTPQKSANGAKEGIARRHVHMFAKKVFVNLFGNMHAKRATIEYISKQIKNKPMYTYIIIIRRYTYIYIS